MINFESLFKITYGLYIVCSGNKEKGNGYISNTVFQVTAEPPQFAVCCNKNNFTSEFIKDSKCFSISVLPTDTDPDIFGRFGFKSGRDINKLEGLNVKYGETGVPIVLNNTIALMECKLVNTFDTGTHLIFIGELLHAETIDNTKEPITYQYFREIKKGAAPKNAPTYIDKSKLIKKETRSDYKRFECTACGYIYDELEGDPKNGIKPGTRFSELPDDWVCPSCGSEKEFFIEIE